MNTFSEDVIILKRRETKRIKVKKEAMFNSVVGARAV